MPSKAKKRSAAMRFRVGDRVRFKFGVERVTGTIVEDRGPLGVNGRRLYAIQFKTDTRGEPMRVELTAEYFRLRSPAA